MIIFDITSDKHPSLEKIINKPIIFFIHTVDTEIEDGIWSVIGNTNIPKNITFPKYITETLEGFEVLSHKGKVLGIANKNQISSLKHLTSYSPKVLEDAVKARYGDGEWYSELDKLLYSSLS